MDTLPLLNTNPTLSRSQLLTEQLLGALRDHEALISTFHPDKKAYTDRIIHSGASFLDGIKKADKERADADGASGAYVELFNNIEQYVRLMRADIRAITDELKQSGQPAEARALRADYLLRQTRLSPDRPGDLRSVIEQFASANTKNHSLLMDWGVPDERLARAAELAAQIPPVTDTRRAETTEFELAVRERDAAEIDFIKKMNPVLRRLTNYQREQPEAFNAFSSILSKFRDDLGADAADDLEDPT